MPPPGAAAESLLNDGHADGRLRGDDVSLLVGHVVLRALPLHRRRQLLDDSVF